MARRLAEMLYPARRTAAGPLECGEGPVGMLEESGPALVPVHSQDCQVLAPGHLYPTGRRRDGLRHSDNFGAAAATAPLHNLRVRGVMGTRGVYLVFTRRAVAGCCGTD